ncbi:hypothetical protein PIB30_048942 [Stylosanthes scabra]|uniref:Uncharacterized protein n=1 Tax=Stylosanthes scabra TaxID=79078 RepID=A0ABU6ZG06_9FABA|nr:hypothetical protein [Stylosanthes scabra]
MTYMESNKDPKESPARIEQLKDTADLLEKILEDRIFFLHSYTARAKVSEYEFIKADTPRQDEGSNDGGVWVAQWIEHSNMWDNYVTEVITSRILDNLTGDGQHLKQVTDRTRMQIALDLVMGKHNPKADEVCKLAISTWDRKVLIAKAKMNPRKYKRMARERKAKN